MTPAPNDPNRQDQQQSSPSYSKKTVDEFLDEIGASKSDPWALISAKVNDDDSLDVSISHAPSAVPNAPEESPSESPARDEFDDGRLPYRANRSFNSDKREPEFYDGARERREWGGERGFAQKDRGAFRSNDRRYDSARRSPSGDYARRDSFDDRHARRFEDVRRNDPRDRRFYEQRDPYERRNARFDRRRDELEQSDYRREQDFSADARPRGGYRADRDDAYDQRRRSRRDYDRERYDYGDRDYAGDVDYRENDARRRGGYQRSYRGSAPRSERESEKYDRRASGGFYGEDGRRERRRGSNARGSRLEPRHGALDKRGESLTLAEEIARRRSRRELAQPGDAVAHLPNEPEKTLEIVELEAMDLPTLLEEARQLNLTTIDGERRKDLIMRVLRAKIQSAGLLFGEGALEILPDEFGFLRNKASRYQSSPDDIYVSPSQIRRFGLRTGLTISGQIRPPKGTERYFALLRVESINGGDPNVLTTTPFFNDLVVGRVFRQLRFSSPSDGLSENGAIDLVAPIGYGHRALVVTEKGVNSRKFLSGLISGALANNENANVLALMLGESPEELSSFESETSNARCEVLASLSDDLPSRHVQIAEIAFEKAKRMVEFGQDVALIFNSIPKLARAWRDELAQREDQTTNRALSPIQRAKKFFSLARQIDGGGSLTIIALAQADEGDDAFFTDESLNEFIGFGNVELWLRPDSSGRARIDAGKSYSRDARHFLSNDEYANYEKLHAELSLLSAEESWSRLESATAGVADPTSLLREARD